MKTQADVRIDMALDAVRSAMGSLRVALQLIGEVKGESPPEAGTSAPMPAMFRAKLESAATRQTAGEAESPQTED